MHRSRRHGRRFAASVLPARVIGSCGVLFAVALAGCSSPIQLERPVEMQVRGQSEPRSTDLADTAAVEAGRGQITVRGTITVPDPCHTELRVSGSASGRELTVRLQARDAGGMCAQVLSAVDYRAATAEPVPPGRWVVRVFHSGADSGGRAALDTVRVRPPD